MIDVLQEYLSAVQRGNDLMIPPRGYSVVECVKVLRAFGVGCSAGVRQEVVWFI